MADYKELLRRAISALPENNGAARRAVYEKARSALVGQLRAIQPPLPARDITQHRLQLEDCIRQVEQEASEAVISLGRDGPLAARPVAPPPRQTVRVEPAPSPSAAEPAPAPEQASGPVDEPSEEAGTESEPDTAAAEDMPDTPAGTALQDAIEDSRPQTAPVTEDVAPVSEPEDSAPEPAELEAETPPPPAKPTSIEEIIAQAARSSGAKVSPNADTGRDNGRKPSTTVEQADQGKTYAFTPRDSAGRTIGAVVPSTLAPRIEPVMGSTALASQPAGHERVLIDPPLPVDPALSSVREVEVEQDDARAAEGAIERAIETLDREARGETTRAPASETPSDFATEPAGEDEASFAPADAERRTGAGLTIFLIVFALLLAGVGGAGFWAWREGFVDLDQMFGRSQTAAVQSNVTEQPTGPTMDNTTPEPTAGEEAATGPGNTATTSAAEPTSALEAGSEERLEPTPEPVTPTGNETVLPSIDGGEVKTEERLSGEDTSIAATEDPAASVDPAVLAGNQSLLLEASTGGQASTVPFSGTVEWTRGTDEIGQPTLVAEASIPARNMSVNILIRKNIDPSLPASHLMEISFDVPDTFVGGSIATLAGVLLKNEELVPGTALAGAAARIVGNTFLFALSASADDLTANTRLLDTQRWMDLAIVYGTGRNAILTLEKDEEAQALFDSVLAAWAE